MGAPARPASVRDAIEQLRLHAHQHGKRELSSMYTLSLLRLDEEAHEARTGSKRGTDPRPGERA